MDTLPGTVNRRPPTDATDAAPGRPRARADTAGRPGKTDSTAAMVDPAHALTTADQAATWPSHRIQGRQAVLHGHRVTGTTSGALIPPGARRTQRRHERPVRCPGHRGPARNAAITGVTFSSAGHLLIGSLYLARGTAPKPTALLLHGCPGLQQNTDMAAELQGRGWNALIFHYRGCWGSDGRYDLGTIVADIRAAVDHLQGAPVQGVDPARLAVAGHSIGGWAAIQAAAADDRLGAVVAIAPLVSPRRLESLSDDDLDREFTRWLTATPTELRGQLGAAAARPGPLELVSGISPRPVLIVHGSADEWIPVGDGRLLHERAKPPGGYVEIKGADHSFTQHRGDLCELVSCWLALTGL